MERIKILIYETDKVYTAEIENTLDGMRSIVKGLIEVFPYKDDYFVICNEEGVILNLPPCRIIRNNVIHGTFFITKGDLDTGEFITLSDQEIKTILSELP